MESRNSENKKKIFIMKFNELHNIYRMKYDPSSNDDFDSFWRLVRLAEDKKDKVTIRHFSTLRTIKDLRNLFGHAETNVLPNVAIPSEEIINSIEQILFELTAPITITEFLKITNKLNIVELLKTEDTLLEFLRSVKENKFSQYPLFDQECFRGIISENSLTNWIANDKFEEGIIDFGDHKLNEIYEYEEMSEGRDFEIFYKEDKLIKVLDIFEKKPGCKNIIVTGKITRKIESPKDIVGIINTFDIVQMNRLLFNNV